MRSCATERSTVPSLATRRSSLVRLPLAIVLTLAVISSAASALAQGSCLDYVPEVLGEADIPENSYAKVAITGDYAYVTAAAGGLRVFDISDPATPTQVGSASIPWAYGVTIAGDLALVTTTDRLYVVSATNPASPVVLGSVALSGGADQLAVSQPVADYAYVSVARLDGPRGLEIVDIRNPASPTVVGFYSFYYPPKEIVVVGNRAYVGQNFDGLKVIDVSNPAAPSQVGTLIPSDGSGYHYMARSSQPGLQNYIFAASGGPGRIDVIDISSPTTPSVVGFVASAYKRLDTYQGILYAAGASSFMNTGLNVIDITTPTSPSVVATTPLPYYPNDIDVSAGIACVPTHDPGLVNSTLQVLSVVAPVGTVGGLTPASGYSCAPVGGVLLQWSPASGATSYEVQFGIVCGVGTTYAPTVSEVFVPGLTPGQTYYWRVRGINDCGGVGEWSVCNSLTTAPNPLSPPLLGTPSNGALDQATEVDLTWSPVPGAVSYDVQFGATCGLGPTYNTAGLSYPATGLTRGETYFWRVRSRDACGNAGNWSGCFDFTVAPVNTPAGQDVVVEPDPDMTLTFDEVTGGGDTTVETSSSNPGPDVNAYMFMGSFYDINTTATYTGEVEVCLSYDDTGMTVPQELGLRLFHLEAGFWVDITSSVDTDANVICGLTTSLSPFGAALFMPWMPDATSPAVAMTDDTVGVSWGDYDGDGDPDLYVVNHAQPDKLFRNDGAGAFTDVTVAPLGHTGQGSVGSWSDYDEDGDLDLYLTVRGGANVLYQNVNGTFVDATTAPLGDTGESHGAAWCDFDLDGDLDLYVSNYLESNRMYRNDGGGSFTDVTASPIDNAGQCTGAALADFDLDGDTDIYITNIGTEPNRLFRNEGGGTWTEATPGSLALTSESRGASWGDYDNDGDFDLYVANGAGPNQLFRNDGAGTFVDITSGVLADGGSARGVGWQDFDNDGDLDLYVANLNSANKLIKNEGWGIFTDATIAPLDDAGYGIGAAWADYDLDGDSDLYLGNAFGPNVLFRNDQLSSNHWLHVRLIGETSNRDGVGARVRVVAGVLDQVREVIGGSGYVSEGSLMAEFGLGLNSTVDLVEVYWPSGTVSSFTTAIGIDRAISIAEISTGTPDLPGVTRMYQPTPNPFNPRTTVSFDIAEAGPVYLRVYDSAGRLVRTLLNGVPYEAGTWHEVWNGKDTKGASVASGVYHVRFEAPGKVETKSVTLIR